MITIAYTPGGAASISMEPEDLMKLSDRRRKLLLTDIEAGKQKAKTLGKALVSRIEIIGDKLRHLK